MMITTAAAAYDYDDTAAEHMLFLLFVTCRSFGHGNLAATATAVGALIVYMLIGPKREALGGASS